MPLGLENYLPGYSGGTRKDNRATLIAPGMINAHEEMEPKIHVYKNESHRPLSLLRAEADGTT